MNDELRKRAVDLAEKTFPKCRDSIGDSMSASYLEDAIIELLLDAKREQAIADCRMICESCNANRRVYSRVDPAKSHIYEHDSYDVEHGQEFWWCDAADIRAAWRAAHGEELE